MMLARKGEQARSKANGAPPTEAAKTEPGTEISIVGFFPAPPAWKDPKVEVQAWQAGEWLLTERDFEAVARSPYRIVPNATEVILPPRTDTYKDGWMNLGQLLHQLQTKAGRPRPKHSVARLNIISHGKPGLVALRGRVVPGEGVLFPDPPSEPEKVSVLDGTIQESTIQWMNAQDSEQGRKFRDELKEMFAPKAQIWLITCRGAGGKSKNADGSSFAVGDGSILAQQLADTLKVTVAAFANEVWIWPEQDPSGRPALVHRDRTSIGEHGLKGDGYFTAADLYWDKEKTQRIGSHMSSGVRFFEPRPGKEPFYDMELGL